MRGSEKISVVVVSSTEPAIEAAFDEVDADVVKSVDEAVTRLGEVDAVVLPVTHAQSFLEAAGDETRVPVVALVGEDDEGEFGREWVRTHPDDPATLEHRVVDAVLADRERRREEETGLSFEELREREAAYRTLVDNIPNGGVSLFDRDLRYIWVGGEVFDQIGMDPDDVRGNTIYEVHGAAFVEQYEDAYTGVFEGKRSKFRFDFAGNTYESDAVPVFDEGEVVAGMTMTRDITDEVERQRDLLVKTRAMDAAGIGLVLTDPSQEDNPLVYVNEGYERMTGYEADEVLGKNPRHLQGPETETEPNARMCEAVANAEPCAVEITNYRKDGTPFVNHVEITPIFDEHGDLVHFLGSQVDVTERAERERTLARQNEKLEEFAAIVSHDLRSPLAVLNGSLELAGKTGDMSNLDRAARALDRMDELIDDLLTLSKEGQSVDDEGIETVQLAAVARETWNTVDTEGATLTVDQNLTVDADRSRLRQLFANLFRNSVEHGSPGSRSQTDDSVEHGSTSNRSQTGDSVEHGETEPIAVRVGGLTDGSGFYVEDDGRGIAREERERVFEAGVTGSDSGTGFGLAIVENVAEAHGWTVSLTESAEGGARFEFRLSEADDDSPR